MSPRRIDPRDPRLRGAGVAAVAFLMAGAAPMSALFEPGAWVAQSLLLVVALALLTVTVRRRTGSRTRPTVVGLGATVVVAVVLAAVDDSPVPGDPWVPRALLRLPMLIDHGLSQIRLGHAPMPPTAGLGLVLILGAALLWLALDLLVLSHGAVGAAALALLALWAPVITYARGIGALGFVLGVVALLGLIAAVPPDGARTPGTSGRQVPGIVTGAALVGVIALVTAPALPAVPGWSSVDPPVLFDLPGGPGVGGTERLASDLDLRASLSDRSGRVTLSYTSSTGAGGPLRLYTLTDFDGRRWSREDDPQGAVVGQNVLWPESVKDIAAGDVWTDLRVTIEGLETTSVPLPLEPRTVEAPGSWRYASERDELISPATLGPGTTYLVRQTPRALNPEDLRSDLAVEAPGRNHLRVPDSQYADQIAELAREITALATDPYSQALALQTYLRNTAVFTYSLDLPEPVTDDAVFDFLTQRTGYCVQFATAFTVMARTLGLPTRVGVGYLPGRPDTTRPGTYLVTGSQAHAWPEVHFEDAGWVRFEPTPAGQTGPPPVYADPLLDPNATAPPQEEFPEPGTSQSPTPSPTTAPGQTGAGTPPEPVSWGWLVLAGALVVLPAVALVRRRRHDEADLDDPELWWGRFEREAAALGVVAEASTTPRELGREIRERQAGATGAVDPAAGAAVDRLVRTVERHRWAAVPPEAHGDEMAGWIDLALEPLRAEATAEGLGQAGGAAASDWR